MNLPRIQLTFHRAAATSAILGAILTTSALADETTRFQQGVAPASDYSHEAVEIRSGSPDHSRVDEEIRTGITANPDVGVLRFLIAFPLDALPSDAVIEEVSLGLHLVSVAGRMPDIQLHRVEMETPLRERQATWNKSNKRTTWNSPGGDFEEAPLSTMPGFSRGKSGDRRSFSSTPEFVAAAQSALDDGRPLILLARSEDAEKTRRPEFARFASPRFEKSPDWRPELIVRYKKAGSLKSLEGNR